MKKTLSISPTVNEPQRDLLNWVSEEAEKCESKVDAAVDFARSLGRELPFPRDGFTSALWSALATIGAVDLTVARAVEPHLDALAILNQAGVTDTSDIGVNEESTWGVFAAEAPDLSVRAEYIDGRWVLDGTKAWCSLAGSLSHALVTAFTGPSTRRLFAVPLR